MSHEASEWITIVAGPLNMNLCPVCHSVEPHDQQLCSNSPETLSDYYDLQHTKHEQDFQALPVSEQMLQRGENY